MRNSHFMLLGVLGLLLVRQGVEGRDCYSCSNCATVDSLQGTKTCSASCMAIVTCQDSGTHFVNRVCSVTNEDTGCVPSSTSADTYNCYCNDDNCDALAADPEVCNAAVSTVASLAVVFIPLLSAVLLG